MSYHNGSVWPHDNSLIAAGLSRYGFEGHARRILEGMYEASLFFDGQRLPELFCGFKRQPGVGPIRYPLACAPQAWAAGAVYLLLASTMGLTLDGVQGRVLFRRPSLPTWLTRVRISGLKVGRDRAVDLEVVRHPRDVSIKVLGIRGEVEVAVLK